MRAKVYTLKNGEKIKLYPINVLANELGRTSQTIRKWEVAGILPKPIFKDKMVEECIVKNRLKQ